MEQNEFIRRSIEDLETRLKNATAQMRSIHGGSAEAQRTKQRLQGAIKNLKKELGRLRLLEARR